jgi:ribosomal protein S12 methylthiotransferase accessory factor
MLAQPRFKPHLRVEIVPGEGTFVLSGEAQTLLRGRLYELIAPHIGAGCSTDDLCEHLREHASPAEIYFTLNQLERKGFLCEAGVALPAEQAAWWSAQQIDPSAAARRLADTPVAVQSLGVDSGPLRDLLASSGVRLEENAACVVVVTNDDLRPELAEVNAAALRSRLPWLLARPVGLQVAIGPLFRPGVTGCWECLAQRLRANRPVESYLHTTTGRGGTPAASMPGALQATFGLLANAVATWVARGELPALEGKIQTFDAATWKLQEHRLVRLPYCPACGSPAPRPEPGPIDLASRPKTFTAAGGHRVVPPDATLERYGHHVSPLTGAVSLLDRVVPAGDGTMHVYVAGHNLARAHRSLRHLRSDLRSMSSGKGATDLQARASGLCEGLERFSGVFRGDEPRRPARLGDLGDDAIHPHACLLFSECQYRGRDTWNAAHASHYNFVPVPFDPDTEIEWSPAWSLTHERRRWLPTAFCYYDYPHGEADPFCIADSNGNAAGNTLEEAILQGFFELVERDSVASWWYNRVRRPGVDLDRFAEPYVARLRPYLREHGREFWVLDLASDLELPVFAAISRQLDRPEERIVLGFGAHLEPRVALLRAVTEMTQMLANLPPEDRPERVTDPETLAWLRTATIANQPYLQPDLVAPTAVPADDRRVWSDDLATDVCSCRARVERLGLEVLVIDQTRPEIGLPVVKVVVPGLRHFWARFAPGRLYDVPVQLGWRDLPLAEKELNHIHMFL